jgi:hypothetical protein
MTEVLIIMTILLTAYLVTTHRLQAQKVKIKKEEKWKK